jgi:tyrosinase
MWDADLLGGNGDPNTGAVDTGPFRQGFWTVINSSGNAAGPLIRAFGEESWAQTLPTQGEIDQVLAVTPYDTPNWNANSASSFRNQLEGFDGPNLHNRGHGWVGGSMLPMTSPNDPVFFLHHCMVDKIWYEWQLRHPSHGYLPVNGGPFGQNLTNPMDSTPVGPVGNRPIDVIDSVALAIEYDQLMPGTPVPGGSPVSNTAPEIQVNGGLTASEIETAGETDMFRFEIAELATYTIETTGPSDTMLTLFGPNSSTTEIASNDDGGENFNARITRDLGAGTYYAQVRLYNTNATGTYNIQVSSDGGAVQIPVITIDGVPVDASISARGESDLFRFQVSDAGTYIVETSGNSDTFLSLYGPDSQSTEIATDDDGGVSFNSRIDADLAPGEYFARVRHYSSLGTGPYSISVTRV